MTPTHRQSRNFALLIFIGVIFPNAFFANDTAGFLPPMTTLSLNEALELAVKNNPGLAFQNAAAEAAQDTADAGSKFFMRNPELRLSAARNRSGKEWDNSFTRQFRENENEYTAGVRFFPNNPWERKSLRAMLDAQTTAAKSGAILDAQKIQFEIAAAYYRAVHAQKRAELFSQETEIYNANFNHLQKLREQEQARAADVFRAKSKTLKSAAEKDTADADARHFLRELVTLIGAPEISTSKLALTTAFANDTAFNGTSREQLTAQAIRQRHDLAHMRDAISAARSTAKWRESEDTFALSFIEPYAGYSSNESKRNTEFGLKLGITIPLFNQDPVRATQALGEARALETQWHRQQRAITAEIDAALTTFADLVATNSRFKNDTAALENEINAALKTAGENPGTMQFDELNEMKLALLDIKKNHLDLQFRIQQTALQLNATLGNSPEGK